MDVVRKMNIQARCPDVRLVGSTELGFRRCSARARGGQKNQTPNTQHQQHGTQALGVKTPDATVQLVANQPTKNTFLCRGLLHNARIHSTWLQSLAKINNIYYYMQQGASKQKSDATVHFFQPPSNQKMCILFDFLTEESWRIEEFTVGWFQQQPPLQNFIATSPRWCRNYFLQRPS